MVSKLVKANLVNLERIANSSRKRAREIIKHADKSLIEAIRQCITNVLNGVVSITPAQKASLKKFRKRLHSIASKKTPIKARKKLIQSGSGFIVPLISAVLPYIIGGVASLIKGRKKN